MSTAGEPNNHWLSRQLQKTRAKMVYKLDPNLLNPMDHLANIHAGENSLTERELEDAFRRVHLLQQELASQGPNQTMASFNLLPTGMHESESEPLDGRLGDLNQGSLLKSKKPATDLSSNEKTGTTSVIQ